MISLPAGLCYKEDSYSYRYEPSVVNTVFATGWTRNRGVEESKRFIYSFTISATQLQVQEFESFYYYDLRNGELEFEAPYWNASYSAIVGTFRILGGYNVKEVSDDLLEISYEAEMMTRDMTVEDALYADFIASGLTWAEFGKYPELKTINIRENIIDFDVANNGEGYIHGYDEDGLEADVDATIRFQGVNYTAPRAQYTHGGLDYSLLTSDESLTSPPSIIIFDTAEAGFFNPSFFGGNPSGDIVCARYFGGFWEYDFNDGAWINFTKTASMCVIGEIETGAELIISAEMFSTAKALSDYEV